MSESDDLKKIITDRISRSKDTLEKTSKLVEMTPLISDQIDEDETALKLINTFPPDLVEESAPSWLKVEIERDRLLVAHIPTLPAIGEFTLRALVSSGSATVASYSSTGSNVISHYASPYSERPEWVNKVGTILEEHTNKINQKNYLPDRLNKINIKLGDAFNVAKVSFNKCQNRMITVDQCAIQLRSVLQQVWGGLLKIAKSKNVNQRINTKDLALKREKDREIVASILETETFPKLTLVNILNDIYDLHFHLSATNFGKNPLNTDFPMLKVYYGNWLSQLDAISGLVA
jgi:hypothetical protein